MIKSAAGRLTLYYLAIIMTLSVSFSFAVYRISDHELDRGLRRPDFIDLPVYDTDYNNYRQNRLSEAHQELIIDLVLFNLLVLAGGGLLSYALARRTLQPIESALERQSQFTTDASHELRTPLTVMQTEIEVALRNKKLTLAQAKDLMGSNLEEVNKLRGISEALLKLARNGGQALELEKLSANELGQKASRRLNKSAAAKNIKIVNQIPESLKITSDESVLTEILTILLDNAIKYSPHGAKIELAGRLINGQSEVSVADQGIGIAAADLPHIFERFWRQDTSRTSGQSSGYGLGLSIANRLVDLHKGNIRVTSQLGQGATFSVRLPTEPRRRPKHHSN